MDQDSYSTAPTSASLRGYRKISRKGLLVILGVIALGAILFFAKGMTKSGSPTSPVVGGASDERIELPAPRGTVDINREFSFPLKNDKGQEVSKLKYVLENAELRDQIVVKGSKASAVKGRTFLILNIKLINDFNKDIEIQSADYIRLQVGANEAELLAPEVHNDPVSVAAISTKHTRLGFPVDDTEKSFKLKIGEIDGPKDTVDINF